MYYKYSKDLFIYTRINAINGLQDVNSLIPQNYTIIYYFFSRHKSSMYY